MPAVEPVVPVVPVVEPVVPVVAPPVVPVLEPTLEDPVLEVVSGVPEVGPVMVPEVPEVLPVDPIVEPVPVPVVLLMPELEAAVGVPSTRTWCPTWLLMSCEPLRRHRCGLSIDWR